MPINKNKKKTSQKKKALFDLPLCSVNIFKPIGVFDSFGIFGLCIRLARNEDPAPNVLVPDTLLVIDEQLLLIVAFPLFTVTVPLRPDAVLLPIPPRPSFTCWAPISLNDDDEFSYVLVMPPNITYIDGMKIDFFSLWILLINRRTHTHTNTDTMKHCT